MSKRYVSVSEVARRHGIPPRVISDLFYNRELRDDLCPIVGGRRLIPEEYVEEIAAALRRRDSVAVAPDDDSSSGDHDQEAGA